MNIPSIIVKRQRRSLLSRVPAWVGGTFAACTLAATIVVRADDVSPPAPSPAAPAPAPPPAAEEPRTHVDSTVVGDSVADRTGAASASTGMDDNDHRFEAGAPGILAVTNKLHLSGKQTAQVRAAIEKSDAGAAILIKRDHDVYEMISATTPQDPLYPKLINEQSTNASLFTDNRAALRRDVLAVLTPAQQTRYAQLEAKEPPKDKP